MDYKSIKGNEKIIENLKASVKNNHISHAYIFDGGRGMGKTMLAKVFAKTLLCEKSGSTPCGECSSCRTFESGTNPDVIYVTHEKKNITVDDVRRQILEQAVVKPFRYSRKVFIIDDAHTMNIQAQNAFLKTLEEPAPYITFLLLSENTNKFLVTVLSRCIVFRLKSLPDNIIKQHLREKYNASPIDAEYCCVFAAGSIGVAQELYTSQEFRELRDFTADMVEKLDKADMVTMYRLLTELEKYKESISRVFEIMLLTYRDALAAASNAEEFVLQKDKYALIKKLSQKGAASLIKCCNAVEQAKVNLDGNADFQLTAEKLFFDIKTAK